MSRQEKRKFVAEQLKNGYYASKKKDAKSTKKKKAANKKTFYKSVDNVANVNTKRGIGGPSTFNTSVDDFESYVELVEKIFSKATTSK
ncbi:conserved hypothetical protein [Ricinus communis]|uniref:Uncharacterized protein n=1 Tax=Ricinus communis TaxID=3988 RepID=B9SRQ4_RICCO|nr:conserved hypothetical protein [Ricinus communis]